MLFRLTGNAASLFSRQLAAKKAGEKRGEEQEKYISRRSFDRTSFVRILS